MARKRLSYGVLGVCMLAVTAFGQSDTRAIADVDGFLLMNQLGPMYSSSGTGDLEALAEQAFIYGFPAVKDFELVGDENGEIIGFYEVAGDGGVQYGVLDRSTNYVDTRADFLNMDAVKVANPYTAILPASDLAGLPSDSWPFFNFDIIRDIEIASDWRSVTNAYSGLLLLDGRGAVHMVGNVNLPKYPKDGAMVASLYPEALQVSSAVAGESSTAVAGPPISVESPSATPLFPYWDFDIARDLEVSMEFVVVSDAGTRRTVGMMNGYYILDGAGAVHSCRLPLNFDLDNDGDVEETELNDPSFGEPINNRPLLPPWKFEGDVPYFGVDIARDVEITPSGNGYYLLDGLGTVHTVGDAHFAFPNPRSTWFGFDIAVDLTIVPSKGADLNGDGVAEVVSTGVLGYYVTDGFGNVHSAGFADDFGVNDLEPRIAGVTNVFTGLEISPLFTPATAPARNKGYKINDGTTSYDVGTDFVVE